MIEANILCIRVNRKIVYIKKNEIESTESHEVLTTGEIPIDSLELDKEVLP